MFQNQIEIKNLRGGKGSVLMEKWDVLPPHCKLYSRITIPEDCSIGAHVHANDEEIVYCLSGNGKVMIDGVCHPFLPGMVDHTSPWIILC
ncbi:MAG TPA: hypothetical protein DD618_00650, partial [Acholeplasmatales bacterium]|nr:hypothetical protein [Acholeplasmatales bacterium]